MSERSESQKPKIALTILLTVVGLVLIVGSVVWTIYEKNTETAIEINSFQECKDAGGRIAESYPDQCFIDDKSFTNHDQKVDDGDGYGGLTEDEALEKASRDDEIIRVVERDGETLPVTMDLVEGRHNLSIEDGRVYKVHTERLDS